jgi:hypothetical protein
MLSATRSRRAAVYLIELVRIRRTCRTADVVGQEERREGGVLLWTVVRVREGGIPLPRFLRIDDFKGS